ncbi:limonene-1,2-epoxide hydrolase family protein [Mycobacterium sp. 236(2023)]|uniref:limonene-1,2-epoxide hydrolase family protein n=1 Tax=Mycobacterium sp. 236(2023) TaxID=3038163 RepID=UPI002414F2EC|nr:limonene-1,2-epoxide hydrolase family protein [Mycobacterium sp. 236(2023)]MDG4665054.1 limonene-1,2-epoxide hydrolase family protein [Mycobacterium sp. 236(2023)]
MTDEALPTAVTARHRDDRIATVQQFLFALEDNDFDTFETLAAPGLVWQNVGLPSIRGRSRILSMLRRAEGKGGFAVKFHSISTDDDGTVLTERTDAIILGPLRLQFWVCGRFDIDEAGQITLWRDYFDMFDFMVKAPLRALPGIFIPALRPKF